MAKMISEAPRGGGDKPSHPAAQISFAAIDDGLFENNVAFLRAHRPPAGVWSEKQPLPNIEIDRETIESLTRAEKTIGAISRIAARFAETGWLHAETLRQARIRLDGAEASNTAFLVETADLASTTRRALSRLFVAGMVLNYLEDKLQTGQTGSKALDASASKADRGNLAVAMKKR